MKRKTFSLTVLATIALAVLLASTSVSSAQLTSYMPAETEPHEGTWLQWPHHFTYGQSYRNQIEQSWIEMTKVLVQSERVHIVAYNQNERVRIINKLRQNRVPLSKVDFVIARTDDFWVRDNGPIYVYDLYDGALTITDWGFNGWGLDAPFRKDDIVPNSISRRKRQRRFNLNELVLEGGAIEVDGAGVLMATKSSILEPLRNPGWTQDDVESYMREFLGVTKFIWLDGAPGGQEDITDMHIDGFARFGHTGTLFTMNRRDLQYWGLSNTDITRLFRATDIAGDRYRKVFLPLTRNSVRTSYGYNIGFKGSYANFYVSNAHVLVPTYNDPNDSIALEILQREFPDRSVVGIDFRNAYRWGGMIHCVTQQQPVR